jgi:citronellol/citronellal dehydrogenase
VIAEWLARAGADVLIAARRVERCEVAAKEIHAATGRRVEAAFVNIRERDAVEALDARAHELFARIDILVNNAGGQFPQPARDFKPKGWQAVIDNLPGPNMTQTRQPMLFMRAAHHERSRSSSRFPGITTAAGARGAWS